MNQSRSERDLVYVSGQDWWSRIVAIGSLAVAGAALYWVYSRDQQGLRGNLDSTAEVKSAVTDGIQQIRDEAGSERRRFDDHVSTAINEVDRRVQLLSDVGTPAPVIPSQFEEPITSHQDTPNSLDLGEPQRNFVQSTARPEVIEVFAVLRVDDLADRPTLIVRNRGQAPARVTHVRFDPAADFDQVPVEVTDMELDSGSADRLVIRFLPADNLAANPKMHGTYQQPLVRPFELAVGQDLSIQVVIANPDHRRYGLRGRLTLLTDDEEIAHFENIAVPFVSN